MTTESKSRPRSLAVKRALMKYIVDVSRAPAANVDALVANIKSVQVLAAQFDELDVKIWGAGK